MDNKNAKRLPHLVPKESHISAAWANITELDLVSGVAIPSEFEVENAKEWVDTNEK